MALCILGKCSTPELYLSPFWIKAIVSYYYCVYDMCVYVCVYVSCVCHNRHDWSQRITLQSGVFHSTITWWLSVLLLSEDTSENLSGNGFILAHSFRGCTVSPSGQGSWEGQAMRPAPYTAVSSPEAERKQEVWGRLYNPGVHPQCKEQGYSSKGSMTSLNIATS